MHKAGSQSLEKLEIICPFCVSTTGRWKIVKARWQWNVERTEIQAEEIDKIEIREFERKVLQDHLDKCSARDYLSSSVLELYKLTR